uniref:CCHC-type domain-containing protein n=1 Tax=Nicotiana tabacum TaxID=4097 RepID=A0A1S4BVA2_TOBAC
MEVYAKYYDVKVWRVIKKRNYPLSAAAKPPIDPEDIDEYTDEQMEVVQVNAKARNLLYNAISGEEYEKISSYDTAKEMWDKLEVTYEGTSKVKETHINILVYDYELFQMKEGEYIEDMFARFSKIISDLKAFGKPYSSGDQVRKILRSLPTTWQTKVVTLESQDLKKLSYDELRGELIAFEKTHLKKTNQEKKKKIVAFKATTERADNDIDHDPEALQEEITMVSRNMDALMRRYRNTRRGRIPPRRTRKYNEQDKNDGKCYECGRFGHVQAECPDLKRKVSRGFNKNKSFGSWSDEDSSENEEIAKLCFMIILENDMNKLSGCWTDEDTLDDECKDDNENCFMAQGKTSEDILDLTLKESQKMINELKRLNKDVKDWKLKLEVCEIEKEVLQDEFQELQMQLNGMRKSISHSSVKSNQETYKSTGEGPARTQSTSTSTNERSKCGSGLTYHYCNKSGHKYSFCRFRKSNISGWIWKPKTILSP